MLVRTQADLAVDEPIEVVLPRSGAVKATVVWSSDGVYGCSFAARISDDDLQAANDLASEAADQQRAFGVDHETLGSRIKRLRAARGYTMRGLADQVGVSKPTLWKWEGDQVRPRHETMHRLAEVLGVSELELAYGAPGLGENVSAAQDDAPSATLADIVRASRKKIAQAAGVAEGSVEIHINWDSAQ